MTTQEAIDRKREHEKKFAEKEPLIQGVLVSVDVANSAQVKNNPGRDWCNIYGQEESQPVPVLNRKTPHEPGLRVLIKKIVSGYEVVDLDTASSIVDTDDYAGQNPTIPHAKEHKIGGSDPLFIYMRAMTMLRCSATGSAFKVAVPPTNYPDGQGGLQRFSGHNSFDLSAQQPASGLARLVLVYLNTATAALGLVAGDTAPDSATIIPPRPAIPDGAIPSAYVRLSGDATKLVETDIIDDLRAFISPLVHNAAKIRNLTVETGTPADGELLKWDQTGTEIVWGYPSRLDAPDGDPAPALSVDNDGNINGVADFYARGDAYGLWDRLVNWGFTPDEHWPQNSDELAWTGWASYTGFATPDTISISNSIYRVAHSAAASKAFRYRSAATGNNIFLRSRVSITQICAAGLMVDDGVDDGDGEGATNFVRVYLQQSTAGGNAINVVEQHRTGGGAVTTNTSSFTITPGVFSGLFLNTFGTLWSSWLMQAGVFGESGARVVVVNTPNMSWTPARVGLYWVGVLGNPTRFGLWDWYDEGVA